jgi:hypothetical protein
VVSSGGPTLKQPSGVPGPPRRRTHSRGGAALAPRRRRACASALVTATRRALPGALPQRLRAGAARMRSCGAPRAHTCGSGLRRPSARCAGGARRMARCCHARPAAQGHDAAAPAWRARMRVAKPAAAAGGARGGAATAASLAGVCACHRRSGSVAPRTKCCQTAARAHTRPHAAQRRRAGGRERVRCLPAAARVLAARLARMRTRLVAGRSGTPRVGLRSAPPRPGRAGCGFTRASQHWAPFRARARPPAASHGVRRGSMRAQADQACRAAARARSSCTQQRRRRAAGTHLPGAAPRPMSAHLGGGARRTPRCCHALPAGTGTDDAAAAWRARMRRA